MASRYFLIPANYIAFDFNRLFNLESADDSGVPGKVLWSLNKNDAKMQIGDICYLYYSNLPDRTSRIILRGIISDSDSYKSDGDEFLEPGQKCIELEKLETINWRNKGRITFTYDDLKNTYEINITRNKRELKDGRGKEGELIDALEDYYKKDKDRLGLEELRDDIVKKLQCAFDYKPKDRSKDNVHSSFVQPNGLRYFETHHFIQQNTYRHNQGDSDLYDAVYDEKNLIYLCPTCHRRIHYGKKDDIRSMIKRLYEKNAVFYDEKFGSYASGDGAASVLEWIYAMYKVDVQEA